MIKRYIAIVFLVMVLAAALTLSAIADVLIEPRNDFFERHQNSITYQRRDYYANGDGGFVSVRTEPDSNSEIAKIKNGEILQIRYIYDNNGDTWGVYDVEEPGIPTQDWQRGWVRMADLSLIYDSISFEEEFRDEIYIFNGSVDALFDLQELVFWKYPGSGIIAGEWDETMLTDPGLDFRTWWDEYHAYTDSDGRVWIAFQSMVPEWVCLSDPANRDIPAFHPAPDYDAISGASVTSDTDPGDTGSGRVRDTDQPTERSNQPPLALVIILIAALAIATAVLIWLIWKKSKTVQK